MRLTPLSLTLLLLAAPGCGSFAVQLKGTLPVDTLETRGPLRIDGDGNPHLRRQRIFLEQERELRRYGVTIVETAALPKEWRPEHLEGGGVMVTRVDAASPLGVAGLRGFDRIVKVNGEDATVAGLRDALRSEVLDSVRLDVVTAAGHEERVIEAQASEEALYSARSYYIPFVFERQATAVGDATGVGPFDCVFNVRSTLDVVEPDPFPLEKKALEIREQALETLRAANDERPKGEARTRTRRELRADAKALRKDRDELRERENEYVRANGRHVERFGWGLLFNLFQYDSVTNPRTKKSLSRFRLFWIFSFGDDLDRDEV